MKNLIGKAVGWIACRLSRLLHPVRFKHRSWGEDFPEKKFLVIRRRGYGMGLFSYFLTNLGWINYAFENGYVPVFLVTEDHEIARMFFDRYVSRLIMSNQECVSYEDGLLCKVEGVSGNLNRGFAYLKAICDLSRCSVLIAGRTSGTVGAAVLSKGFSYSKVFSLGVY